MATADDIETYRQHSAELIRYATVLVGPADAADVVTDAVLAAFAAPAWRNVTNRRAYLYRTVLNRSTSLRRSAVRRLRREHTVAARVPAYDPPGSSIDAHRALSMLSAQQRAVTYLTYWEDLAPDRVAELLGVSEGTVRKQLSRARDHLRRILDA